MSLTQPRRQAIDKYSRGCGSLSGRRPSSATAAATSGSVSAISPRSRRIRVRVVLVPRSRRQGQGGEEGRRAETGDACLRCGLDTVKAAAVAGFFF